MIFNCNIIEQLYQFSKSLLEFRLKEHWRGILTEEIESINQKKDWILTIRRKKMWKYKIIEDISLIQPRDWKDGDANSGKYGCRESEAVSFLPIPLWPSSHWHQHHLESCWKGRVSSSTQTYSISLWLIPGLTRSCIHNEDYKSLDQHNVWL